MRKDFDRQLKLDVPSLDDIDFDPTSRHELEAILMALKHIYESPHAVQSVLRLIARDVGDAALGCEGLTYWEILVLAAVRLGGDLDYDALADLATNHRKLRVLIGVGDWQEKKYPRSIIHDNVKKLKPETLRAISRVIVALGQKLEPKAIERVRGDSFVVQTNIHYPTDANLMVDGVRTVLRLSAQLGRVLSLRTYQPATGGAHNVSCGQKASSSDSKDRRHKMQQNGQGGKAQIDLRLVDRQHHGHRAPSF